MTQLGPSPSLIRVKVQRGHQASSEGRFRMLDRESPLRLAIARNIPCVRVLSPDGRVYLNPKLHSKWCKSG